MKKDWLSKLKNIINDNIKDIPKFHINLHIDHHLDNFNNIVKRITKEQKLECSKHFFKIFKHE